MSADEASGKRVKHASGNGNQTAFERKRHRHASGESTMSTDSVSHYIPTPPDGGYGWVIVAASLMNHVIADGVALTFGIFFGEFVEAFGASKGRTSLVGALLVGFYSLSAPIASALVNKFGCRPVAVGGSIMGTISFVLCTFSPNIEFMMLTYGVLGGCSLGILYLPNIVAVSFYFQKYRAIATGIAVSGAGIGCCTFAPLCQFLLTVYDWKNAMLIIAAIFLNGCVFGSLLLPLDLPKRNKKPRAKNILDRLREQARTRMRLPRTESECSNYSISKSRYILHKLQVTKLARESALREEEGSWGACSPSDSVLNSLRNLDKADTPDKGDSRMNSVILSDGISYQPTMLTDVVLEEESETESHDSDTGIKMKQSGDNEVGSSPQSPTKEAPTVDEKKETSAEQPDKIGDSALVEQATEGNVEKNDENKSPSDSEPTGNGVGKKQPSELYVKFTLPENSRRHDSIASGGGSNPGSKVFFNEINGKCNEELVKEIESRRRRLPMGVHRMDYSRPLYRQDIFYSGSVLNMTQYTSQPNVTSYVKSITTIPDLAATEKEAAVWRCLPIAKAAKDTLKQMTDLSLLADPLFLIPCIANLFASIGIFIPFVYIADRAMHLSVPEAQATFLLSVIGITNTLGRFGAGALANFPWVNSLLLHNMAIIFAGVSCVIVMFCTSFMSMCIVGGVFGICAAMWISLTSIVLCNLIGLERLTNAFGLLCMTRGVAAMIGSPVAGLVLESTGDYDAPFHFGGAMFLIGGLLCLVLHLPRFRQDVPVPEDSDDGLPDDDLEDV